MNNRQVENKVSKGFANATPKNANFAADCNGATARRSNAQRRNYWKYATCALALILIVMATVGVVSVGSQTASAATVSLDVNPSIDIQVNAKGKVVKVVANNQDGQLIVGTMDFEGCSLEVTVNALIGSMLRNGYLSDAANSVLVSVEGKQELSQTIIASVTEQINVTLGASNIQANVISQWLQKSDEANTIAAENSISVGKARLIQQICTNSQTTYNVAELAKLSVNELSHILKNLNVDVSVSDTPSEKSYVGRSFALEVALEACNLTEQDVKELKIKLDFEDGTMVYEVEFVHDNIKFELEIEAISGSIISSERETITPSPSLDQPALSEEKIKSKALQLAGVPENKQVQITCELDGDEYEVEFVYEQVRYEMEFDLYGNLLKRKEKAVKVVNEDDPFGQFSVSIEKAKQIVLRLVGAVGGDVEWNGEVGIDEDDGMYCFEFEFKYRNYEYEIKIDANTGAVVKIEKDKID